MNTCTTFSVESGEEWEKMLFNCVGAINNFQFNKAEKLIHQLENNYPDQTVIHLLKVNYYWWQMISGNDSEKIKKEYLASLENAFELIKNAKGKMGYPDLYHEISACAFKARYSLLYENYLKTAILLDQSISIVKKSFGKEEEYNWFYLTSGIYNYYIDKASSEYVLLLPYLMFLPNGDAEKGIDFLKKGAASSNIYLSAECRYFLMKIYLDEQKFEKAYFYASALESEYPQNLLYQYYSFLALLKNNQKKEAIIKLSAMEKNANSNDEIDEQQKKHFVDIAKKDLENYSNPEP